jgi:hypothetical protein
MQKMAGNGSISKVEKVQNRSVYISVNMNIPDQWLTIVGQEHSYLHWYILHHTKKIIAIYFYI